ncbi:MAG TPA: CHASE2 domain-containing protein [Candidatus Omnitrophota bacterium]|nr:CHASE2 domain-containing protein [Candidatus Omnitrophota bacterium]HNQ51050.1 CHASE2 domain-containing protein [Candidatus Omnitrophota bacterium]
MKRVFRYWAVLVPVLCINGAVFSGFFDHQEMAAYDWLMRTRPVQATHPGIAVIEIADDTIKALGRWPLSRDFHAALIDALTQAGCRMIVFDILLAEPSGSDPVLSEVLRRSGRVFLPMAFQLERMQYRPPAVSSEMLAGVAPALREHAAGAGHINIIVDRDGKVRRVPAMIRHGSELFPSLGVLAASQYLGVPVEDVLNKAAEASGAIWVNYPGPWTRTFSHYSYLDVLRAAAAMQKGASSWLDLSVLKDAICFVGLTAAGTSDFRANPIDPVYPMVGTQASVCDSILRNAFVKRAGAVGRALIGIAVAATAFAVCAAAAPVAAFGICIAVAGVYVLAAWTLFAYQGIFIDVFLPLACIGIVYAVVLLAKFFEEVQKRRLLEKELEIAASIQRSFLPPDVRRIGPVDIRAYLKAARFVGGDLYDIIALDEAAFGVFIGDVSGKGVSASLIMAQTISLLRVAGRMSRDPAEVLYVLNNQLKPLLNGRFVTGQYVVVHHKDGYWEGACAGHPAALVTNKTAEGVIEVLPASGPPLGLMENIRFTTVRQSFTRDMRMFMYTDGWTEARSTTGREFGIENLKNSVTGVRAMPIDEALAHLEQRHAAFEGKGRQFDDITAVVFEYPG